jgi:cytochrome c peroxidase
LFVSICWTAAESGTQFIFLRLFSSQKTVFYCLSISIAELDGSKHKKTLSERGDAWGEKTSRHNESIDIKERRMKMTKAKVIILTSIFLMGIGGIIFQPLWDSKPAQYRPSAATGIGNAQSLLVTYNQWKTHYREKGGDTTLGITLGYNKALSQEFTTARGNLKIDLIDGNVSGEFVGLADNTTYDIWLIDNRPGPGHSVKPEPGDGMVQIGSLKTEAASAWLNTRLDPTVMADFTIDLVAVTRAASGPEKGGIIFGSPSFFQRLYYSESYGLLAKVGDVGATLSAHRNDSVAPFGFLIPTLAHAAEQTDTAILLDEKVAQGEAIFFNEQFEGNGRTCGTCHPAENNFTIDPAFINKLTDDDPLFVAEFNPDLADLEKPELMRQFGMILENLDGFDQPGVLRGVPHTLALSTSITPPPGFPLVNTTGWSGDGAPGDGSLRSFATGAVIQHFPKTLDRIEGIDFRLPTDDELDALEAFQLSLGRNEELDLAEIIFTSPVAERGKELFNSTAEGTGKCILCHNNAGANVGAGFNPNINTGVEELPSQPARLVDPTIPRDGGFGREPDGSGGFGDGTFNIPSVVEAADTPPFFHNNSINTIELSVAFFNSEAFNNSPAANVTGVIQLEATEVVSIATFCRAINALENIRNSNQLDQNAREASIEDGVRILGNSIADIDDAIEVLTGGVFLMNSDAVQRLEKARKILEFAQQFQDKFLRDFYIIFARQTKDEARSLIVVER